MRALNERAVDELVAAHKTRTDEPLVLAIRYEAEDPLDIHLLEILRGFPGGDDDELLPTSFEPSASLRILGKLHLVLGSPQQAKAALVRNNKIITKASAGTVVYEDGSDDARDLKRLMDL